LLRRGNVLGALLGVLEPAGHDAATDAGADTVERRMTTIVDGAPDLETLLATLRGTRWTPPTRLVDDLTNLPSRDDGSVARHLLEEWLPGRPTDESSSLVQAWIRDESARLGASGGAWLADEPLRTALLRRLAHLVFSLPEAHLG
jgi:hypothetical protein